MVKRVRFLIIGMIAMIAMTACTGGGSSDGVASAPGNAGGSVNGSIYDNNGSTWKDPAADADSNGSETDIVTSAGDRKINQEMLVYTCNMSVDVLKFDEAVAGFRSMVKQYGGFVENENYTDDQGNVSYYYDNKEIWHNYKATVRIPSAKYEQFTEDASGIGDLRSRTSEVKNVSTEYYDAQTELSIYEAKQKRYLALLETIQDEAYAIEVEKELTNIEIHIAKLKTRMNDIETDVAYSYVTITIHEVKKYKEEVKTDTFEQRLVNVFNDSWNSFLDVTEKVLFTLIFILPYALFALIIVLIVLICLNRKYHIFGRRDEQQDEPEQSEQQEWKEQQDHRDLRKQREQEPWGLQGKQEQPEQEKQQEKRKRREQKEKQETRKQQETSEQNTQDKK